MGRRAWDVAAGSEGSLALVSARHAYTIASRTLRLRDFCGTRSCFALLSRARLGIMQRTPRELG
jgi:hypothetical protein